MHDKKVFPSELAYVLGIFALAVGTALSQRADFGMSMVVAPAYLLHRKVSQVLPAFSFGVAEYAVQAGLLLALALITRRPKRSYLLSFATEIVYGLALDLAVRALGLLPAPATADRVFCFAAGLLLCATGVAFLFHTYLPPEAYELFVKELAAVFGFRIERVKTIYDCCSCLVGVLLSFAFYGFGRFEGVKLGTVICALVNGWLIGRIGKALEAAFDFRDALPLRDALNR